MFNYDVKVCDSFVALMLSQCIDGLHWLVYRRWRVAKCLLFCLGSVDCLFQWTASILEIRRSLETKKRSFAELVAYAHANKKAMTYTRWLIGKFATLATDNPQNQADKKIPNPTNQDRSQ